MHWRLRIEVLTLAFAVALALTTAARPAELFAACAAYDSRKAYSPASADCKTVFIGSMIIGI